MNVVAPQTFIIREECEKAAWQHGFRRRLGEREGWAAFGSTTARGTLWLAAGGPRGPWFLAMDHPAALRELGLPPAALPGPGVARHAFPTLTDLYAVLPRLYELAASLPDAPLAAYREKTAGLPGRTEAERLVLRRVGQEVFRESLLRYWGGRCPLTGIEDAPLLRASHIIPWSECPDDATRLDVHNGLLLSALWDAAFDRALVTFDDDGAPRFSPALGEAARAALRWNAPLPLTDLHREHLRHHRRRFERLAETSKADPSPPPSA